MPRVRLALALLVLLAAVGAHAQAPSFVAFESGPVRPMALSPDGKRLYVVNTPDNRLEIFTVTSSGLVHFDAVPVGMEPVAVAARSDSEIWVVNHLSDSVSIVSDDRSRFGATVTRTLLVGDEPRDIVFAGPGGDRAFVTTAHRGQHRTHPSLSGVPGAGDPELTQAGEPRADVWVFDANALGVPLGGVPIEIVELFGDTPRALAASPDGSTVYAAVFHSGNQTAVVNEGSVCDGFTSAGSCSGDGITSPNGLSGGTMPGGNPGPATNHQGIQAPESGLVVQYDEASGQWRDELDRNWSNGIRFFLPDLDVFAIDADTLNQTASFPRVGTILFNMAVNPVNGNLYVSNTEAQNLTRFEGAGGGGSTVQGDLARSRITVIEGGNVKPRHLNRHIDYGVLPAPPGVKDHSLATPLEMAVSSDGTKLFVTAFGSSKVGVFDTADLENDALFDGIGPEFDPTVESANYIDVSGGGPAGVVLDEANDRLYVATRFDNGVSAVDLATGSEIYHLRFPNPEPASLREGRFMLYDAARTSSNGEASCSSCHVFGDFDSLAWDLGDPDGDVSDNPMPINLGIAAGDQNGGAANDEFHPMKGPMTTQTLRGLPNSGAMHWRGDRADGFFGTDASFNGGSNDGDEELSFMNFIVAFPGLVGLDEAPTNGQLQTDMQKFTDFMLQVQLPPNPVRALDNSLTGAQEDGREFFLGQGANACSDGICSFLPPGTIGFSCDGCHQLDPAQGFFGTGTFSSFENETQIFKIPHLRNLYQKVGMFGMPDVDFNNAGDNGHKGSQVRGTGFLHDGSTDTLFRFFQATVFNDQGQNAGFDGGNPQRRDVEEFMLAFETDLAPAVGQQVTLDTLTLTDPATVGPGGRLDLLEQRADSTFVSKVLGGTTTECDLVVKGTVDGVRRGWLFAPDLGTYEPDSTAEPNVTRGDLETLAASGTELTFTCVPPGSGVRMALDRDEDGFLDFDEITALTDPANAGSAPGACNDGVDNDGDGLVDLADPGCKDAGWDIENPECNDGVNNDADGLVDLADPNCGSAFGKRERNKSCGLLGLEVLPVLGLVAMRRRSRAARRA